MSLQVWKVKGIVLCTDWHELHSYWNIPRPLHIMEEAGIHIRLHGLHCNLYQNQYLSFLPAIHHFFHSLICIPLAAATGIAGYFSHVSTQQRSQARPWSPRTWKEPSSGFWIHPGGFLSIGYTLNTSKRMHSDRTLFKSRIHFSWVTLFPAPHFRCQDPSLTSL